MSDSDAVVPTLPELDLDRAFREMEKFPRSAAALVAREFIRKELKRLTTGIQSLHDAARMDESADQTFSRFVEDECAKILRGER